jgi:hypothetical protein
MSKNNQLKLKQVKENNIKYNAAKDVEIISPNYSNLKINNEDNQIHSKQHKINIKIKEEMNENKEKEIEKEKEKEKKEILKEKNMENLSNENNINKYIEKIKELEEKIKKMNLEYKNEIQQKEKDIKRLVNTNTNLKNSLEVITQRLDKVLINQKLKKTNKSPENKKEDLQYQLEIKEKELKNQQQLINILKKDNKNIRNLLNNFGYNENNLNLVEKVQQQYKDLLNLQRNFKEYKEKHSSSQTNITGKKIKNLDEDSFYKKRNKKIVLNSVSPPGHNYNTSKNKSQNKDNTKKSYEFHGLSSSFNYNKDNNNIESVFNDEEKKIIKKYFGDDEKYQNFIKKISILEKSSIIKEKEMIMKIRLIENKLKDKENELIELKKEAKEKDSTIIVLNVQNKELKKTANELINKINILSKSLNELDQKNQLIMKKNQQIKNTIFSIDGIIEAKSKEGNTIPIIKDSNSNNDKSNIEESIHSKNGNISSHQTNKEEKNKNIFNITNSNSEEGSDNL